MYAARFAAQTCFRAKTKGKFITATIAGMTSIFPANVRDFPSMFICRGAQFKMTRIEKLAAYRRILDTNHCPRCGTAYHSAKICPDCHWLHCTRCDTRICHVPDKIALAAIKAIRAGETI
jgi:hypothetical protein